MIPGDFMGISLDIHEKTQWYEHNNVNEIDGMTQEGKPLYLHGNVYNVACFLCCCAWP